MKSFIFCLRAPWPNIYCDWVNKFKTTCAVFNFFSEQIQHETRKDIKQDDIQPGSEFSAVYYGSDLSLQISQDIPLVINLIIKLMSHTRSRSKRRIQGESTPPPAIGRPSSFSIFAFKTCLSYLFTHLYLMYYITFYYLVIH